MPARDHRFSSRRDPQFPTAATCLVGVIGDPIEHSLSPLLHNAAFAEMDEDLVSVGLRVPAGSAGAAVAAMRALPIVGLSVTMPHKEDVVSFVDELTEPAARLHAVNCLFASGHPSAGSHILGHNTDGSGFLASLERGVNFDPAQKRCMVVGTGGAGRAVAMALAGARAREVVIVARKPGRAAAASDLAGPVARPGAPEEAADMDLVVDATPVHMQGTASALAQPVVPARFLRPGSVAVDLVYHPLITPWLEEAEARGVTVMGGLGMLVHQAAAQLQLWLDKDPPVESMWAAAQAAVGAAEP